MQLTWVFSCSYLWSSRSVVFLWEGHSNYSVGTMKYKDKQKHVSTSDLTLSADSLVMCFPKPVWFWEREQVYVYVLHVRVTYFAIHTSTSTGELNTVKHRQAWVYQTFHVEINVHTHTVTKARHSLKDQHASMYLNNSDGHLRSKTKITAVCTSPANTLHLFSSKINII